MIRTEGKTLKKRAESILQKVEVETMLDIKNVQK